VIVPLFFFITGAVGLLYSMQAMDHPNHRECKSLKCRWFISAMGFNLVGFSSGSWLLLAYGASTAAIH
jgi:hypothetical protein